MGIKDLWTILGPLCDRKPLYELQGKTVAIDLSGWVCEAQNITEYQVQPRMYLRNLYFRTCYLLLLGVNPIFVLDGKAPTIKYKTIASRNALQFKGAKPKTDNVKCKDRTRFNHVLKRCEEMLKIMGISCITANGEAEALCAHLNEDNLVHGCITQDSDCFAYGAKIVYKNFSISQQGVHAASGGAIDVFDIEKLMHNNGIGRQKIIALALLCGSDYNDGVYGVGKEAVLKLFSHISEDEILNRLRSWKTNSNYYENLEKQIANKNVCSNCGHSGNLRKHEKKGCDTCDTSEGCKDLDYRQRQQTIKNELNMRKRSLESDDFPNEELIEEFLKRKDNINSLNLKWSKPDMIKYTNFTKDYLQWDELYAMGKFLPILTRWQMLNSNLIQGKLRKGEEINGILHPSRIKKIRNPKGIPSYEIIWEDRNNCFKDLIPEEQLAELSENDLLKIWSTVEPQHLIDEAYPDLVELFNESRIKPKKKSKRKLKDPEDKSKKNKRDHLKSNQKTIDTFLKKTLINNAIKENNAVGINDSDISFSDETDSNLSDIVENIVQRGQPDYIEETLKNLQSFNSNFFLCNYEEEEDAFEKTFNEIINLDDSNESDEKYEMQEEPFTNNDDPFTNNNESDKKYEMQEEPLTNNDDDSFNVSFTPLLERAKILLAKE